PVAQRALSARHGTVDRRRSIEEARLVDPRADVRHLLFAAQLERAEISVLLVEADLLLAEPVFDDVLRGHIHCDAPCCSLPVRPAPPELPSSVWLRKKFQMT